jgi:acetolactate synthase-1/2/3 large subunit
MAALEEMADLLTTAERPLLVVGGVGRHPASVHHVARLAETLGAPVIDFRNYVNLPPHHPLNAALDGRELLAEADAVLLLDVEMPCLPGLGPLPPHAWLLQVDTDCLRSDLRNWTYPVEIAITADTGLAMPPLLSLLADRLAPRQHQIQQRRARAEASLRAVRQSWRERAGSGDPAAAADALLAELNRALPEDALVMEESAAAGGGALRQLERPTGHFFRCVASAGWSLGAALGARIARPLQPVISVCDDRAFADGLPTATFWTAHRDGAAFLTVVLDRDRRQKPRPTTRSRLPDGSDVIELARASGAETAVVSKPSEVAGAVERMLATTRDGVCAVLALKLPPQ